MTDPRDPNAAERLGARRQAYHDAMQELDDTTAAYLDTGAIDACRLCDELGYRPNGVVCDHVDRAAVANRGSALVRQALADKAKP